MGSRYLTNLATVLRNAGLQVQEEPGWQTRSRSSGGYDSGLPNHVMCHHTASGPSSDGQPDVDYCTYHSSNRPVANLYVNRGGKFWVMAAGATNTNGAGSAPWGGCPDNRMNTHAIGIEAGNSGTGEAWPKAQTDAYLVAVRALEAAYSIQPDRARSHHEYAPRRKIDPAGPSPWATGRSPWNMNGFRQSVGGTPAPGPGPGPGPSPGPAPTAQGDDVALAIKSPTGTSEQQFATFAYQPGLRIGWITNQTDIDVGRLTGTLIFNGDTGEPLENWTQAQIQDAITRLWAGGPKPPGWK